MIEELKAKAEALGIKVDGRWKESKLLQVIADASDVEAITPEPIAAPDDSGRIEAMNAYALRIWNGQGSSELRTWRVERVKAGLIGQGYEDILEHLSLPNA